MSSSILTDGYLNSQRYVECQLVTIINAAIHLGEDPVLPGSEEYERLVDLVMARDGGAIRPEYALDYLRLDVSSTDPRWASLKRNLREGTPVEYGLHHPRVGFHSVLVIDWLDNDSELRVRVANLPQSTDENMWMDWGEFKSYWYCLSNWEARRFRLKKSREYELLKTKLVEMGYPHGWWNRKLKKSDKSPSELFWSGSEGIDLVKAEVDKRLEWKRKKRRREIGRLKSGDVPKNK